jgi:hypothetical protein
VVALVLAEVVAVIPLLVQTPLLLLVEMVEQGRHLLLLGRL